MSETFLELRSIAKTYPGVIALDEVSLSLAHGEVLGLIGENGAGKSTMMKVLGGVIAPTSGTIVIDGVEHARLTVTQATTAGIAFVHQELNLFENLDVAAERVHRTGARLWRACSSSSTRKRCMRASGRSWSGSASISNRPTWSRTCRSRNGRWWRSPRRSRSTRASSSWTNRPQASRLTETDRLLEVIADLQAHGVSTIYISHRLGEVKTCCDRVVVLRDGRAVGELAKNELTHAAMARMMIGRDLKSLYIPPKAPPQGDGTHGHGPRDGRFPDRAVTLSVRFGEILGLAGLVGSGRSTLAQTVFGVQPPLSGSISLDGAACFGEVAARRDLARASISFRRTASGRGSFSTCRSSRTSRSPNLQAPMRAPC